MSIRFLLKIDPIFFFFVFLNRKRKKKNICDKKWSSFSVLSCLLFLTFMKIGTNESLLLIAFHCKNNCNIALNINYLRTVFSLLLSTYFQMSQLKYKCSNRIYHSIPYHIHIHFCNIKYWNSNSIQTLLKLTVNYDMYLINITLCFAAEAEKKEITCV